MYHPIPHHHHHYYPTLTPPPRYCTQDSEHDNNDADIAAENSEIAELLDEIENYRSDSDPDNESLTTVHSTPKPQLRSSPLRPPPPSSSSSSSYFSSPPSFYFIGITY